MLWLITAVVPAVAGVIQTVTGFGSVVVMMLVFPYVFHMVDAPTLALSINVLYCIVLCWKHRKSIDFRAALLPTAAYAVVGFVVTGLVKGMDLRMMALVFAAFLIALSLYLLFISDKLHLNKPGMGAGAVCGVLAGVSSGMFAIGGPVMAPYMLSATRDHTSYVASMQFLFVITNIVNVGSRMIHGIFNWSLWPYVLLGSVTILIGMKLGELAAHRLDARKLRFMVNLFVGLSGVILLFQQL